MGEVCILVTVISPLSPTGLMAADSRRGTSAHGTQVCLRDQLEAGTTLLARAGLEVDLCQLICDHQCGVFKKSGPSGELIIHGLFVPDILHIQ